MENKDFEVFVPRVNWDTRTLTGRVPNKLTEILKRTTFKAFTLVYNFNCKYNDPELTENILVSRSNLMDGESDDLYEEDWVKYGGCNREGIDYNKSIYDDRTTSILPIIKLSNQMFDTLTSILSYGTKTLELGFYPKQVYFLTPKEKRGRTYTGKTYTLPITAPFNLSKLGTETQTVEEYEINNEKYIDIIRYKTKSNSGGTCKIKETYKIEPITWYIDWNQKCLIASEPLLTGIEKSKKGGVPYKESYLYEYLNNQFLHDAILQHQDLSKEYKVEDEITALINEISVYAEYYHGSENINEIVRNLITKYNNDILESKNSTGLTLISEDGLRLGLISDLNIILDKLKRNMESSKEYNDILEFIDKCINALHGKETECDSELYKDIFRIHSEIFPRLTSDHKNQLALRKKIIDLFIQDKKDIKEYLEYISTFNTSTHLSLTSPKLRYKNLTDYETYFRIKLHPVLESMVSMSKNEEKKIVIESRKNMLNEISKTTSNKDYIDSSLLEIYNGTYEHKKSNNTFIDTLLDNINEELRSIRRVKDIEPSILSLNLENYDILSISKALSNILIVLHKINLDIEEEKSKTKKLNKYLVKI